MGEEEAELRQLHAGQGFLDGLGHLDTCCRKKVVAIPAGAQRSLQSADCPVKADRQPQPAQVQRLMSLISSYDDKAALGM